VRRGVVPCSGRRLLLFILKCRIETESCFLASTRLTITSIQHISLSLSPPPSVGTDLGDFSSSTYLCVCPTAHGSPRDERLLQSEMRYTSKNIHADCPTGVLYSWYPAARIKSGRRRRFSWLASAIMYPLIACSYPPSAARVRRKRAAAESSPLSHIPTAREIHGTTSPAGACWSSTGTPLLVHDVKATSPGEERDALGDDLLLPSRSCFFRPSPLQARLPRTPLQPIHGFRSDEQSAHERKRTCCIHSQNCYQGWSKCRSEPHS